MNSEIYLEKRVYKEKKEAVNLDSNNMQIYREINESAFYLATAT
jgi:hypothetical protein